MLSTAPAPFYAAPQKMEKKKKKKKENIRFLFDISVPEPQYKSTFGER
jgi:hypothetical protein